MNKSISELTHHLGLHKTVDGYVAAQGDPIHKPAHSRMTSPGRSTLPELTQRRLEESKHPNQIGTFEIIVAGTDIA